SPPPEEQFDPKLKASLRRAWPAESAPPELHERVKQLLLSTPDVVAYKSGGKGNILNRPLSFRAVSAIAAICLLGIGIWAYLVLRQPAHMGAVPLVLSDELVGAMIAEHDQL